MEPFSIWLLITIFNCVLNINDSRHNKRRVLRDLQESMGKALVINNV